MYKFLLLLMNIHICCVVNVPVLPQPLHPTCSPVLGMLMGRLNFGMLLHVSRLLQFLEVMSAVKSAFTPGAVFLGCKKDDLFQISLCVSFWVVLCSRCIIVTCAEAQTYAAP